MHSINFARPITSISCSWKFGILFRCTNFFRAAQIESDLELHILCTIAR